MQARQPAPSERFGERGGTRIRRGGAGGGRLVAILDGSHAEATAALNAAGYRVRSASSSAELFALVWQERPDVVVMDLVLPDLGGMETALLLKSGRATCRIPLIAGTASWLADRPELLGRAGFDGAVRKPFEPARLVEEVERVLSGVLATARAAST